MFRRDPRTEPGARGESARGRAGSTAPENREEAQRCHSSLPEAFDARPDLVGGTTQGEGIHHLVAHRPRDLVEAARVLEAATQVGRRRTEARELEDAVVRGPA